ncbi:MAG: agmatinase [Candidatus Nanohalarchaeota archaeon]|nr:MAG: agmatinase [Candidatus Nanohaloarchaeota archaeon]
MGSHNFCWLDWCFSGYDESKVVVVPVGFEGTVTYGKGSGNGAAAIIEASGNMELYDEECGVNPSEKGIHTVDAVKVSSKGVLKVIEEVRGVVEKAVCDGKFPVVLGGEHTVCLGGIKGMKGEFSVLCIDAHADLRDKFDGSKYNHACVMRRAFEFCGHVVLAGVRSLCEEEREFIDDEKICVFYARDMVDGRDWISKVVDSLRDDVYVSFDVDALDPSFMPATGTPEPGGVSYYDVIALLLEVAKRRRIVGFDVVELAPVENLRFCEYTAAKIVYKLLAYREFYGGRHKY